MGHRKFDILHAYHIMCLMHRKKKKKNQAKNEKVFLWVCKVVVMCKVMLVHCPQIQMRESVLSSQTMEKKHLSPATWERKKMSTITKQLVAVLVAESVNLEDVIIVQKPKRSLECNHTSSWEFSSTASPILPSTLFKSPCIALNFSVTTALCALNFLSNARPGKFRVGAR